MLGIPTVIDRFVQQCILQVLQKRLDPTFSESSYGFRPGRRVDGNRDPSLLDGMGRPQGWPDQVPGGKGIAPEQSPPRAIRA